MELSILKYKKGKRCWYCCNSLYNLNNVFFVKVNAINLNLLSVCSSVKRISLQQIISGGQALRGNVKQGTHLFSS